MFTFKKIKNFKYCFYWIGLWILICILTGGGLNILIGPADIRIENDIFWEKGSSTFVVEQPSKNRWGVRLPGCFSFCRSWTNYPNQMCLFVEIPSDMPAIKNVTGTLSLVSHKGQVLTQEIEARFRLVCSLEGKNVFFATPGDIPRGFQTGELRGIVEDSTSAECSVCYRFSLEEKLEYDIYSSWSLILDSYLPPSFGFPLFGRFEPVD